MKLERKIISLVNKATALTLPYYGARLPIVVVNEYPKCGGTWFAKMLADAIDLPFVDGGYFVPSVPAVLRTHWDPKKSYGPGVCVIRDARDVMVSLFHHRCKNIDNVPKLKPLYQQAFGEPLNPEKIKEQLAGFIEIEVNSKRYGSSLSWSEHTSSCRAVCKNNSAIALVRYEELIASASKLLGQTIEQCFQVSIGEDRLDAVASLHNKSMSQSTILDGTTTKTTFIRSGTSGGWRASFSAEAALLVHKEFGVELLEGGFESDENWWKSF